MTQFLLLSMGGLRIGAIYALSAVGLVVIHKATKTVNFAHGAFIMLGSYGAFLGSQLEMPYWAIYLIVPVFVGSIAAVAEYTLLRRLREADAFSVVITTVFLSILLTELVRIFFESEVQNVPPVFSGPPLVVGPIVLTLETLWIFFGAIACGVLAIYLFSKASLGRSMRAMASSMRGAQLCGYSVDRVYASAWFLGGLLAALAGVFVAPRLGVSPELAIVTIVPAFVAAIIGGFDSLKGAVLGGLILGLLETYMAAYVSSAGKNAATFLVLLFVLLIKPEGLFPERKARNV